MTPSRHAFWGTMLRVLTFAISIVGALALIPERMTTGLFVFFLPTILVDRAWTFVPVRCVCGRTMKREGGRPPSYGCASCGRHESTALDPEA